jgi:hypothetical protein
VGTALEGLVATEVVAAPLACSRELRRRYCV